MSKIKSETVIDNLGRGLPRDICQKCFKCFQWAKSPCNWCFWCHNPEPKNRMAIRKPISKTNKLKDKKSKKKG